MELSTPAPGLTGFIGDGEGTRLGGEISGVDGIAESTALEVGVGAL